MGRAGVVEVPEGRAAMANTSRRAQVFMAAPGNATTTPCKEKNPPAGAAGGEVEA